MSEASLEAHPITRSTSSLKCLAYDSLPPELWLKIFPELPRNDIQAITLTSSSFRLMAQPLLFSVFDVSPFFMEYHTSQPTLRPRQYLDRTVERLKCYRLKHIAPAVKHCWISPYSRKGFPPRNRRDYLEPALIIEAVMEALPSFPNLSMLTWHCLDMTPQWWSIIQRLPIQTFWFNSCTVFGPDSAPRPVKFLDLDQWAWEGKRTNHVSVYEDHIPGVSKSLLSLVLHPDHIRRITVPRLDTAETLLTTIADMEMLRCINTLCLPATALSSPNFIPALIKCPTLEEIRISALEEPRVIPTPGPIPPDALPSLTFYEGPYSLLMSFAAFRRLRGIKLWGIDEQSSYCNVTALLEILHHLSETNTTLEVLDIAVTRITPGLLNHLSSFPALEAANISSCDGPPRQEELPLVDEFEITYNSPVTVRISHMYTSRPPLIHCLASVHLSPKISFTPTISKFDHHH
ncbi:hypothetical protein BD779DRAFT_1508653 [Infundibulicybe gibba]|nr:hypothetical protein BD779DRAFT_1508653 [Infundibulicybe gibba]